MKNAQFVRSFVAMSLLLGTAALCRPAHAQYNVAVPAVGNGSSASALFTINNYGSGTGIGAYCRLGNAIYAWGEGTGGRGVWGYNNSSGIGVEGQGTNGYGVLGYSINSTGAYGYSVNDYGMRGYGGNIGVYAHNLTANGNDVYLATRGLAGDFYGNVYVHGGVSAVSYNYLSDARFKTHIETLPNALDTVLSLRGVSFEWRRDEFKNMGFTPGRQIGFIAQEVEKSLPELVQRDEKGYRSVAYANLVPVLVEAMKAQQRQIDALKVQNETLSEQSKQMLTLQSQLAVLEAKFARRAADDR